MKKLLTLTLILIATPCFAWTISWDAVTGVDGYRLNYKEISAATYSTIDAGSVTSVDLDTLGLVAGTRYEFYAQHYTGTPPTYGGDSDHIRWTYPAVPQIIELPAVEQLIININP